MNTNKKVKKYRRVSISPLFRIKENYHQSDKRISWTYYTILLRVKDRLVTPFFAAVVILLHFNNIVLLIKKKASKVERKKKSRLKRFIDIDTRKKNLYYFFFYNIKKIHGHCTSTCFFILYCFVLLQAITVKIKTLF